MAGQSAVPDDENSIIPVTIPAGLSEGSTMAVIHNGQQVVIQVPAGVSAGDVIQVAVPSSPDVATAPPVAQVATATAVPASTWSMDGGPGRAVEATPVHVHPQHVGIHAVSIPGFTQHQPHHVMQMASNDDLQYAEALLRMRAWVSCFAIMDVFLIILSIFTALGYWGLLLLIGPLYGYYGARSLRAMNIAVYLAFKFFHTFLYFMTMLEAENPGQFTWSCLLVICEIYITFEVYKFYKFLRNLDEEALVRAMQQLQLYHQQGGGIMFSRHHGNNHHHHHHRDGGL